LVYYYYYYYYYYRWRALVNGVINLRVP
jgi:hypothetical protein